MRGGPPARSLAANIASKSPNGGFAINSFRSAGETAGIRPASHWLDRIQNRRHPVIGAVELEELRSFDRAVWEDGDGSMHSDRLVRDYRGWLERWKNHDAAPEVERRIAELLN